MAIIVPVDQLGSAFNNAMNDLYRSDDSTHTVGHMIAAWKKHYDCYLFHDQMYDWESVGFKNQEQYTWFVLKWS